MLPTGSMVCGGVVMFKNFVGVIAVGLSPGFSSDCPPIEGNFKLTKPVEIYQTEVKPNAGISDWSFSGQTTSSVVIPPKTDVARITYYEDISGVGKLRVNPQMEFIVDGKEHTWQNEPNYDYYYSKYIAVCKGGTFVICEEGSNNSPEVKRVDVYNVTTTITRAKGGILKFHREGQKVDANGDLALEAVEKFELKKW